MIHFLIREGSLQQQGGWMNRTSNKYFFMHSLNISRKNMTLGFINYIMVYTDLPNLSHAFLLDTLV